MKKYNDKSPDAENTDERIVIFHEDYHDWCRDDWDHTFVLYSNTNRYRGDKNAESPFDDEGKLRESVVAFPVSVYDHSGLYFSLGSGSHFPDHDWDVTENAMWLWTDKEHYERMCGEGSFESKDEKMLRTIAENEIKEMNLDAEGNWYGWRHERKVRWTKNYEDGQIVNGWDWEVLDSCGGYLTDCLEEIDLPSDAPVYLEDDVYIH